MATPQEEFQKWMDSQSGYIGKENKAQWWNDRQTSSQNQQNLAEVFNPNRLPGFSVSGSEAEKGGKIEGLQRARILTGQTPYQIGNDYQQAYGNIKKRSELSDTGSELLRNNKAGAVADTRNQLRQDGVKGGAAAGATSQVERAKSYDVNNQLQQAQRQAEMDYLNATKANANFTQASEMNQGALAAGKDIQMPGINSSGFGTVICTELFMQGILPLEIMSKDFDFGLKTLIERPAVYWGYRFLADPVVKGMKKSKMFTKLVASLAIPWANNMAGNKNLLGATVSFIGEPICWVVGKIIITGARYAN